MALSDISLADIQEEDFKDIIRDDVDGARLLFYIMSSGNKSKLKEELEEMSKDALDTPEDRLGVEFATKFLNDMDSYEPPLAELILVLAKNGIPEAAAKAFKIALSSLHNGNKDEMINRLAEIKKYFELNGDELDIDVDDMADFCEEYIEELENSKKSDKFKDGLHGLFK